MKLTFKLEIIKTIPVNMITKFRSVIWVNLIQMDLDENGSLSKEEFNLFNWRTSGEQVSPFSKPSGALKA